MFWHNIISFLDQHPTLIEAIATVGILISTIVISINNQGLFKLLKEVQKQNIILKDSVKAEEGSLRIAQEDHKQDWLLSEKDRRPLLHKAGEIYWPTTGIFECTVKNVGLDLFRVSFPVNLVHLYHYGTPTKSILSLNHDDKFIFTVQFPAHTAEENLKFSGTVQYLDGVGNRYEQPFLITGGIFSISEGKLIKRSELSFMTLQGFNLYYATKWIDSNGVKRTFYPASQEDKAGALETENANGKKIWDEYSIREENGELYLRLRGIEFLFHAIPEGFELRSNETVLYSFSKINKGNYRS